MDKPIIYGPHRPTEEELLDLFRQEDETECVKDAKYT